MPDPITRGSFQVDGAGALIANQSNVDALRNLWASRPEGLNLGPGVNATGAWHVACHLVAGGCVRRSADGQTLWLEISHVPADDTYVATVTAGASDAPTTSPLDSDEGRALLESSTLLGFVEGSSEGHITARGVTDPPGRFGQFMRQNYDKPVDATGDGGRVWEHWCTTRDLSPDSPLSVSLLTAYLELCNAAGDRFAPTVARGRTDYGHPEQLVAMIEAGFTTEESARWRTSPKPISPEAQLGLYEATAVAAHKEIQAFEWSDADPAYFMFQRRIDQWAG
jgi:hypothetical protein